MRFLKFWDKGRTRTERKMTVPRSPDLDPGLNDGYKRIHLSLITGDFADRILLQAGLHRTGPPGQDGPRPRRPEELPSTSLSGTRTGFGTRTPIFENSGTWTSRTRIGTGT